MSDYVIEIKNLSYSYEYGQKALDNVNIAIKKGEFVSIIGQNGAGKSTLLKNITGILRPTEGQILVNGQDTKNMAVSELALKVGFVLQNPDRQLFANTVAEEISFGLKNLKLQEDEIKRRTDNVLKAVGLENVMEEFPPALSKGDRAKVVIASVIAMGPEIIILDEPTSGQDYRGCYQVMDIAKELNEKGHTVVVVTHHMALVAEYTNRTIVMAKTKLMMDDRTDKVFAQAEKLAETHITPPQITQVAAHLEPKLKLGKTVLSVKEFTDALAEIKRPEVVVKA